MNEEELRRETFALRAAHNAPRALAAMQEARDRIDAEERRRKKRLLFFSAVAVICSVLVASFAFVAVSFNRGWFPWR